MIRHGDIGGPRARRLPAFGGATWRYCQRPGLWGTLSPLPPLCRPAGWIALWKRTAMVGKLNARSAG